MIKLLIPENEAQLALIKSILDTEEIPYYVHNDHFGSMWAGPQIALYNEKAVMVDDAFVERAKELLQGLVTHELEPEEVSSRSVASIWDKLRMVFEVLLFGWIMPSKR